MITLRDENIYLIYIQSVRILKKNEKIIKKNPYLMNWSTKMNKHNFIYDGEQLFCFGNNFNGPIGSVFNMMDHVKRGPTGSVFNMID